MAEDAPTPAERIAEAFNRYFANFNIRVEAGEVRVGSRREIVERGWHIRFRVIPDDAGSKEANEEEYLRHNRQVAEELRAAGLYPDGDINAYLRTGADRTHGGIGSADAREGGS